MAINNWGESDKPNYKHKTKVSAKLKSQGKKSPTVHSRDRYGQV